MNTPEKLRQPCGEKFIRDMKNYPNGIYFNLQNNVKEGEDIEELSKQIQEKAFSMGIYWASKVNTVIEVTKPILFISKKINDTKLTIRYGEYDLDYLQAQLNTEINPYSFLEYQSVETLLEKEIREKYGLLPEMCDGIKVIFTSIKLNNHYPIKGTKPNGDCDSWLLTGEIGNVECPQNQDLKKVVGLPDTLLGMPIVIVKDINTFFRRMYSGEMWKSERGDQPEFWTHWGKRNPGPPSRRMRYLGATNNHFKHNAIYLVNEFGANRNPEHTTHRFRDEKGELTFALATEFQQIRDDFDTSPRGTFTLWE